VCSSDLSGGVDSPLVSAVTRRQSGPELKAYTIGNPGWRQDESADAKRYAAQLDLEFHLQNVSGQDIINILPDAWSAQYEPFGDYSVLPTLLVSRFAREALTVALSGDGGDELFFGYERPFSLLRDGHDFRLPWAVRYGLYAMGRLGLGRTRSEAIAAHSPSDYYFGVNSRFREADLQGVAPGLPGLPDEFDLYAFAGYQGDRDLANYSRQVEFYGQLQRGLKKVDMASMYHSLEVRVPLLDREVIEISLRIDPATHMQGQVRKQVLVRTLERYVPAESIPQTKRGFAVPMGEWLRGPLRPLVEDTLFGRDLYPLGLFHKTSLRRYWNEHLTGQADHKWGLWTILSLQYWAVTHSVA
jgi:asparagine synthase (glutamine-hydrolysing)